MADQREIGNKGEIIIDRITTNATTNETTTTKTKVGNYYFIVSRELKQMSLQLFLDEAITDEAEKKQIAEKYKIEYLSLINDSSIYGWDILDVRDKATTTT